MSNFPPARPQKGRAKRGPRKGAARPARFCLFTPSSYEDYRGVPICGTCDMPRDHRGHDLPETPPDAAEVDERRTR